MGGISLQWPSWRRAILVLGMTAVLMLACRPAAAAEERGPEALRFEIKSFEISGNTIFGGDMLKPQVAPYLGPGKTAADVEAARSRIEKFYHKKGYPTVLVNIPEQRVDSGEIRLEVIESKIRRVRVTGNRYYTMKKILKLVPSLQAGTVLYLPRLQADLARLNRHPDLKVAPTLSPGRELGTIDVELKVKDKLPLHGSLELNNRHSHGTSDLRLNALIKYDNLWQRDHSATLQYQTAPLDTEEVQAYAGSYMLTPFWNDDHILAIYGIYSDSNNAFGEGFQTTGKGLIIGLRNVIPLAGSDTFYHNFTLGLDYKDFKERLGFEESTQQDIDTPVTYMPLSLGYGAVQTGSSGSTEINLSLNLLLRDGVTDRKDFEDKRYKSRANYVYTGLSLQRTQHMGAGWDAVVQLDGQVSDQPLVSNEQYYAGGMNSVHGYKESEAGGDNAFRGRLELVTPDMWDALGGWTSMDLRLHGYYDYAQLTTIDPLPGEDANTQLQGVGAALTGALGRYLDWECHWGLALDATERTEDGSQVVYFAVKAKF